MIESKTSIINVKKMQNSATVIIPTTGTADLAKAVTSVINQTHPTDCYVVVDGPQYIETALERLKSIAPLAKYSNQIKICCLPDNVGADSYYGHRTYAAFTHLVNTDYVLYLDQDNWFEPAHVEQCISTMIVDQLDWCYALRNIYDKDGVFVCRDNCESLGKWPTYHDLYHIDTNSYCFKTDVASKLASAWHGKWGQDRVFFSAAKQYFPKWDCTRKYTVNYKVDGNNGSVDSNFFINGNKIMQEKYNGEFPWQSDHIIP